MEYQRDEHRVHLIVYHRVWGPKRRKAVLGGSIAKDCQSLIEQKCAEKGWEILELAIQLDHIYLFVRVWPSDSAADVVKECKGLTTSPEVRRPASAPLLVDSKLLRFDGWQCLAGDYPALYSRTEGPLR